MADRELEIVARIARGVSDLPSEIWDRLAPAGDPFLSHAFLSLLEQSGSVGEGTGWTPLPVMVERAEHITAAAPAYLKTHSQGEYVFDHGWADAWQRAGGDYYPKLQVSVPFTPCVGRRLLGDDPNALLAALETVTVQNGLSSAHVTFLEDRELEAAVARGWLRRDGLQFHWLNRAYGNFDDFLGALASRKRKAIRKERLAATEGIEIVELRGAGIEPAHWEAMWTFYQHTGARKWGRPYLTRAFFDQAGEAMGNSALMFLALSGGRPIAGALNFVGGDTLYGRYWGAIEDRPFLHFELSYYRAIDFAIAHGLKTIQAGAQGEHKLSRGYEPVITASAHFLPDPGFRGAVADFLVQEREAVRLEMEWARAALPYRSDSSS
ncbi:GNAT family N-acetyltransferase [Sphingomonas sp. NSE70-1]|uniref:GNAT family N-acetyltransferase n=1 Tax=Sphingomonas caseinilyticus TaxID=2908205 RepID=A0ABT0RV56_9SPHN|nr:GNAT family N-acetyltransferase [Sphingomonas caseinilyticus]MCL6698723.1 GNAT family N-acetyltransferase [Sphingomonas caseinilyticus]